MHEVTNVGTDRSQLAHMAKETKATLEVESLDSDYLRAFRQALKESGYVEGENVAIAYW